MSKTWTGERLETFILDEIAIDHLHRYAIASIICKNLEVLDIASGEGYGSMLLSKEASNVIGVDISKETVENARNKYKRSNLVFKEGSASKIPIATRSIDVAVSFETLEHHDKHQEMIDEIKRVLKPNGVLLMSSPDKKYYSDVRSLYNVFHVKELYYEEFKNLIKGSFTNADFLSQKHVSGSLILNEKTSAEFYEYSGNYDSTQVRQGFSPLFNLCVASDGVLPNVHSSLFDSRFITELAVSSAVSAYKGTWSYKIGHLLLSPLRIFK